MKNLMKNANEKMTMAVVAARAVLTDKRGESLVGQAIFPVEDVHDTN